VYAHFIERPENLQGTAESATPLNELRYQPGNKIRVRDGHGSQGEATALRTIQFLYELPCLLQFTDHAFCMITKQLARLGQYHLASEPVH
jgi:hypothetical protein